MNYKFDEMAKTMAQSVTRRGALKKFGLGLAGLGLALLGLPKEAEAHTGKCRVNSDCPPGQTCCRYRPTQKTGYCTDWCGY